MPVRIVDADPDRNGGTNSMNERVTQSNALAEFFKAMPWFVWALPGWLLAGLICLAISRYGYGGFASQVLGWLSIVPWIAGTLCGVKAVVWCHNTFHKVRTDAYSRRLLAASVLKAEQGVVTAEKKNALLDADLQMAAQMPNLLLTLTLHGAAFEYTKGGNLKVLGLPGHGGVRVDAYGAVPGQLEAGEGVPALVGGLPTKVLYEEVRGQVPAGHFLVGVGKLGIETLEAKMGACTWIVGLSGTGKTSTTVIRVEERASIGHKFLGVDPHWFKDDSLYHSIYELIDAKTGEVTGPGAYAHLFLRPIARNAEEAKAVLQAFLDEFHGRQSGRIAKPWQPITLLVDELGSLIDATTDEEEEVKAMLKRITRICGQEARNFMMGGIFISQQATELAWLRKVALVVIVHQLMQESEKKLATNDDKAVMLDMKTWPIGRTYVYGVGFGQEGPRTVQQPYYAGRRVNGAAGDDEWTVLGGDAEFVPDGVESSVVEVGGLEGKRHTTDELLPIVPALSGDMLVVYNACQQLQTDNTRISSREVQEITGFGKDKCNSLITRLEDLGYIPRRKTG